jgi:hypothetical protein
MGGCKLSPPPLSLSLTISKTLFIPASRKKFAAAAKRFFSRKKKKGPKPVYPSNEKEGYNTLDDHYEV